MSWRSTAVRSSSEAGPSTACDAVDLGRAWSWNRFRARSRFSVVIGPLVWKIDLVGRRPAGAAILLEGLVALARALSGGRLATFGGPVSSASAGADSSSKRDQRQQHRDARACSTSARRTRTHGFCAARSTRSVPAVDVVPTSASPAGIANSADRDGQRAGDDHAERRRDRAGCRARSAARRASPSPAPCPRTAPCARRARSTARPPPARRAVGQLLAEARHDQQRVVDAEREPDHRQHVERERVELEDVVEDAHRSPCRCASRPGRRAAGQRPRSGCGTRSAAARSGSGSAISSPLSSESSDAWLSARTSGARPDTSAGPAAGPGRARSTAGIVSSEISSVGRSTCSVSSTWPGGSFRTRVAADRARAQHLHARRSARGRSTIAALALESAPRRAAPSAGSRC